jgi:large conductance mechanosensitive channel
MLREFRDFISRGNVLDLAVAVIVGGAFGAIINSLVNDLLMPLVGIILGGIDFTEAIINFLIISFFLFLVVRGANRLRRPVAEPAAPPPPPPDVVLLTEIRDILKQQQES